jgi:multiple sugar transport system permease protein
MKLADRWMRPRTDMTNTEPPPSRSFRDSEADRSHRAKWWTSRIAIYGVLILWTVICLFPIYWTITTSFKMAPNVMKGNMIPWVDYHPRLAGLAVAGPVARHHRGGKHGAGRVHEAVLEFGVISVTSSALAVVLGSLAAYGLSRFSYKFGFMKNSDISFFFLSS